jgi:pyridinium-3,5-biscarboxylic acid mononucleotide sulfurtransferase
MQVTYLTLPSAEGCSIITLDMMSHTELDTLVKQKLNALRELLANLDSAAVAFSGGTDSTLLLRVSREVLENNTLAITAVSETLPEAELAEAEALAQEIGVEHILLATREVDDPDYQANAPDRCYHCRRIVFGDIVNYVHRRGFNWLLDGANADDLHDHRPGGRAAKEHGVRSPLQEVGLGKAEIRQLARHFGLPNWDKPATPCLATRIPYGTPITRERIEQIRAAESALKSLAITPVRVRHHGTVARIEVTPDQLERVFALRESVVSAVKEAGFTYVAIDLEGFRSGSMNEVINTHGYSTPSPPADRA